jgi:hypothetical protein
MSTKRPNGGFLHDRLAVVVLAVLWVAWLIVQFITGTYEATQDALHAGDQFSWGDYVVEWLNRVAENNASEMYQVIATAVIFKWLLYKESPESREGADQLEADVAAIKRELGIE